MAKIAMIGCAMVLFVVLMANAPYVKGAISCDTVLSSLSPCQTYLTQGGNVPAACCKGISSLNSAAKATADRQTACNCIKTIAKEINVNPKYAASLPSTCHVKIGYPISYNTNCNSVK